MTFDEARSEAVQGARITSPSIQTGAYVDYQFHGLRIVYASGSHSGFRPLPDNYAADWLIVGPIDVPAKRDKWGRSL